MLVGFGPLWVKADFGGFGAEFGRCRSKPCVVECGHQMHQVVDRIWARSTKPGPTLANIGPQSGGVLPEREVAHIVDNAPVHLSYSHNHGHGDAALTLTLKLTFGMVLGPRMQDPKSLSYIHQTSSGRARRRMLPAPPAPDGHRCAGTRPLPPQAKPAGRARRPRRERR